MKRYLALLAAGLLAFASTNANAQITTMTNRLMLQNGSSTITLMPPTSGGAYQLTFPTISTNGMILTSNPASAMTIVSGGLRLDASAPLTLGGFTTGNVVFTTVTGEATKDGGFTFDPITQTLSIGKAGVGGSIKLFNDNGNYLNLEAPNSLADNTQVFTLPATGGTLLTEGPGGTALTNDLSLQNGADLRLYNPAGTFYTEIGAGAQTQNFSLTLPTTLGIDGQVLTLTNVNGLAGTADLVWTTGGGGSSFTSTVVLRAGTTAAGTSPMKFTFPSSLMTTPENGALETDGENLFFTDDDGTRKELTAMGNTFNGPNQLVQLDGTGMLPGLNGSNLTNLDASDLTGTLPALDGSNLTNLNAANLTGTLPAVNGSNITALDAGNISSGTLSDSRLSSNVTLQGNTFNGISQLVRTDGTGKLPAIDGSQLTNIASAITTLDASKLTGTIAVGVNGSNLTNLNAANLSGTMVADLGIDNGKEVRLYEPDASGTEYSAFKSGAQASSITYTLPAANGNVNDVLTISAVGANTATLSWLPVAGGGGNTFATFNATASSNQLALGSVGGGAPFGTTLSATAPSLADRTYTIPDAGADASFVMTEGAQTINGAKTFTNAIITGGSISGVTLDGNTITLGTESATPVAGTVVFHDGTDNGTAGSGGAFTGTLSSTNPLTANRTYTLPDASGELALSGSGSTPTFGTVTVGTAAGNSTPTVGTIYKDNVIGAWAEIDGTTLVPTINADFGIASVSRPVGQPTGVYDIDLNNSASKYAVVVTCKASVARVFSYEEVDSNTVRVRTYNLTGGGGGAENCVFSILVFTRP